MARKSKIRFEWDLDRPGCLLAIRDHGKITLDELKEAINADSEMYLEGHVFALGFYVSCEYYGKMGWMDGIDNDRDGDVWELWDVQDGEPCPICRQLVPPQYCPECGCHVFPLTEMGGNNGKAD